MKKIQKEIDKSSSIKFIIIKSIKFFGDDTQEIKFEFLIV